jgi:hypothetical protein
MLRKAILLCSLLSFAVATATAQELNCKVKINHAQIQGTNTSLFETLETALNEFMNNRSWTEQQYAQEERIECNMNITVKSYNQAENGFACELLFQLSRPVFNSNYSTVVFSMRDLNFNFTYKEFDQLEFNINSMDNQLTALMAYYAYLFIGMDMDTFSPLGGTEVLHVVEQIVNNAQTMGDKGWKAFDDNRNRHGIINDYMDGGMEPFRQMQYKYHREGLDEMSNNADRGRTAITEAIEMLQQARSNKPLSDLPIIFTDYKRDELVNIYRGHGTAKEKENVYNTLSNMNASQNNYWKNIQK